MPVLTNRDELKQEIKKDFVTYVNFANKNDLNYEYLVSTLNGQRLYHEVIEMLKKLGYQPKIQYKKKS